LHYNNGETILPAAGNFHYVEWKPVVYGQVSVNKRFFTQRNNAADLWYTEAGTHVGAKGIWWQQSAPNGDWFMI
jgi:hypothetical protein